MKSYKIIERKKLWFSISLVIIIAGLFSIMFRGFNWGIDFTGGTLLQYDIKQDYRLQDVRNILKEQNLKNEVKKAGDNKQLLIIKTVELTEEEQNKITESLRKNWSNAQLNQAQQIDAVIGTELRQKALVALLLANLGMFIYIAFRFEFKSAIAAVLALLHDVLIVISFYTLAWLPVDSTFIAVILTIVGYSINDTIVIFDRIRENARYAKRKSFSDIANSSITQTLSRTINTTVTTLLAILALYIFGGTTIKDFTLALIVGVVSGTYSSIFIASPIWDSLRGLGAQKGV